MVIEGEPLLARRLEHKVKDRAAPTVEAVRDDAVALDGVHKGAHAAGPREEGPQEVPQASPQQHQLIGTF